METINSCRVCKSKNIRPFFDLGEQPLANSLLKSLDEKEKFYPLSLSWCQDCSLIQLNQTVEPEKLFSEYLWVTGTSRTAREFAEIFYQELISRSPNKKDGYVLEVASNDGTFLLPFIRQGYKVLGIDPAENLVEMTKSQNVPTKCAFFSKKEAKLLLEERGAAKILFARNVLPHVADTRDFIGGLSLLLSEDGTLAIEAHYAKIILDELHYDSIYHEHLCYFTFKSLEKLLNDFGLYIFDIAESPISGGSLIVYAKKKKVRETSAVKLYREQEAENKINNFESWQNFAERADRHRRKFLEILHSFTEKGKLVGYGASARSSTLLNFCQINSNLISMIADQNSLKQNLFTAGTRIQIVSPEKALAQNPKAVVVLAWNFAKEIEETLRNKFNYKGEIIIPLPKTPYIKETL